MCVFMEGLQFQSLKLDLPAWYVIFDVVDMNLVSLCISKVTHQYHNVDEDQRQNHAQCPFHICQKLCDDCFKPY